MRHISASTPLEKPVVIPALQTWTGGSGTFTLPAEPTIATHDAALAAIAAPDPALTAIAAPDSALTAIAAADPALAAIANRDAALATRDAAIAVPDPALAALGTRDAAIAVPDSALAAMATRLAADLTRHTGRPARVADAGGADVVLVLDPSLGDDRGGLRFDREGYRLEVTAQRVVVTAPSVTGLFYGTRSLLQMLVRGAVPVGTAVDWPNYESRGFMLDVGRRFFTAEAIRGYIEVMGWYKLNEFQLHLNDNEIKAPDGDWTKAKAAFRLRSDNPEFSGLAAEDGAYDRAEWDSFEDLASANGVTIIPEIDAPGHARAFVAFRPELGLDGGNSDHLDLSKPESTDFVRDVFTEFMPWFRAEEVHYGTDEYFADPELYRGFFNDMAAHVRGLGKRARAWGSATRMTGTADGYDRGVTINSWNNGWYGPAEAVRDGYRFINTNDDLLYIVPYADYYRGEGLDGRWLYENWEPHVFADGQVVEPGEPLLLGAMSAVWNDLVRAEYTELDVWRMVEPTFGLLAQKMWAGGGGVAYETFMEHVREVGSPGQPWRG
ncbi:glycoside hydrolase family 20 protein [Nonomuraea sp. NPDC050556]|uniref:glycoside hydrolase family 20 protein n=1 Tax=Nonomuraea sp. NPDC050556 TaxID=3364369 RepID=UPI0037949D89